MKLTALSTFLIFALLSTSCKDDDPEPADIPMEEFFELYGDDERYNLADYTKTSTGLLYKITEEGTGDVPQIGDQVKVHYTGYHMSDFDDERAFDSSWPRGYPFSFDLGAGRVIAGWDEGIALLKTGGIATLFIPYELAYGKDGSQSIGAYEDLRFEVKLVSFK